MSGVSKPSSFGVSVARYSFEGIVALLFLVFALETFSHRHFSPDPRYRVGVSVLAALCGAFGFIPLLLHFSPRAGGIWLLCWLGALAALLLLGWLTKP